MKNRKHPLISFIFFLALVGLFSLLPRPALKESISSFEPNRPLPFKAGEKFCYEVKYNNFKAGNVDFTYEGRKIINKSIQDVIVVNTSINILNFFRLDSKETVYLNPETFLPHKVERDVTFLGKHELILEEYNQREGKIKITSRKDDKTEEKILTQKTPIQHSHILCFLYPLNFQENLGKTLEFYLTCEKLSLKIKELRAGASGEVYVLEGSPKKFVIEVGKEKRIPLKLELPAFLGKITITKI